MTTPGRDAPFARHRAVRPGAALAAVLIAAAALIMLAVANFHLVYVATTTQPDCVPHVKPGESRQGTALSAARSVC
jgi:hypothetical protein